jgi:hypothetical protein
MPGPLDRAARSFVNHRIGGYGCRPKFCVFGEYRPATNLRTRRCSRHRIIRDDSYHVFLGRSGVREGTIPGRKNYALVSLDTRRPCRLRRNLPPRGRWSLPFLAALETRTRRFASLAAAMVAASLDTRALRAPRQGEVLRPMVRATRLNVRYREMTSVPVARFLSRRLWSRAWQSHRPSQADDIRAHRQQNGDAYGDNDQEEFSHCSASRRPQRKAAGIVLC